MVSFFKTKLQEKSVEQPVDREKLKAAWYGRSQHIGSMGETLTILARVNKSWQTESKWGVQCIVVLETEEGSHIKIKSRSKDTSKYKYIRQTIINRVSILKSLDHIESSEVEKRRQELIEKSWMEISDN